ncbi:MAG: Crp/Fnr family transcriptional regulator [Kiloniellales bacterium]|nr:Crp/Fnr family transcriptional regulator [Kiloniellales bacterium]
MIGATETLANIDLFEDAPPELVSKLAARCQWNTYRQDQQIVGHQDESRQVFFLVRGKARAIVYSVSGKEVTFRDITAGEMFGEFAAIDGKPRAASVQAIEDCLVASMSPQVFWGALEESPAIMAATLQRLVTQIRDLSERVFEFTALGVKNRIHAELLRLASQNASEDNTARLSPAPKHAEIASRISSHREAVTRELNRLDQDGVIKRKGNTWVIQDMNRLSRMVHDVIGH